MRFNQSVRPSRHPLACEFASGYESEEFTPHRRSAVPMAMGVSSLWRSRGELVESYDLEKRCDHVKRCDLARIRGA